MLRCSRCRVTCAKADLVPHITFLGTTMIPIERDEDGTPTDWKYRKRERRDAVCRACTDELAGRNKPTHMLQGRKL